MNYVRISFLIISVVCLVQKIAGKILNEPYECDSMNKKHWKLIQWFYGKTDKIDVTYIASSQGEHQHSRLQDKILRELFQSNDHIRSSAQAIYIWPLAIYRDIKRRDIKGHTRNII